jgi:hypothetical protein
MGTRLSRHNKGRKPLYKEFRLTHVGPETVQPEREVECDNSFLFCANVKTLTLDTARSLGEPDAYEAFKAIRWAGSGGEPVCVDCGSLQHYARPVRRTWLCINCGMEFSVTSRTVFASHKMAFHVVLKALAVTVGASPAKTLAHAAIAIGITSKSAFTFVARLREAAKLPGIPEFPECPALEIGRPRYIGGRHMSTRTWWSDEEKSALARFIGGGFSPDESADALGRSPTSIAHYARDRGIHLPRAWSTLIVPRRQSIAPAENLSYPYILKRRPEHGDLLAVNDLVPKAYPPAMRADICQDIMLAILEGQMTLDEVKANRGNSAWFVRKFWRDNHEAAGRAISLGGGTNDDERSYDEVASSIAAKDWHSQQFEERTRFVDSYIGFQAPTQIDDVWHSQIRAAHAASQTLGFNLSFSETVDFVESGEWERTRTRQSHFKERALERHGPRLNRQAMGEIAERCRGGHAQIIDEEGDDVMTALVEYAGKALPVVYSRRHNYVITVLKNVPRPRW